MQTFHALLLIDLTLCISLIRCVMTLAVGPMSQLAQDEEVSRYHICLLYLRMDVRPLSPDLWLNLPLIHFHHTTATSATT